MRSRAKLILIPQLLSVASCAPYALEPLTANHPADPRAAIAAAPPPSRTLVYTAADLPVRSTDRLAAADQGGHEAHHGSGTPGEKTVVGEGKVIAVVPSSNQLVIEHGAIKGFMDPMTMGYPTDPASLLEGLKPGDRVRFAIDVNRKVIVKVEKLN
jgi:Cu/Ag efflux protein CusF